MTFNGTLRDVAAEVPAEKPSLKQIADMPYPLSLCAMRKHYNAKWGIPVADGETLTQWKVKIHYETRETGTATYNVEAMNEEEAKELAEALFDESHDMDDEVTDVEAEEVSQ
jgi:hypothetical protein